MDFAYLIVGLAILIFGGEILVKGAISIAYHFKLSPLVVGMTVVSFGTSAPELLVSIKAALSNHAEIAIGNVVGSNISNLALVLGITTLIFPLPVKKNTIKIDWPVMMGASILFYLAIFDLKIERWEGVLALILLLSFIIFMIKNSRKEAKKETPKEADETSPSMLKSIVFIVLGCVGLAFGASLLLDGAVSIAQGFGISEHIIGVTIVAFGTSVPELTTSIIAAVRKQTDISLGNLIGSNIFNLLAVLGTTAVIKEIPITAQVLSSDVFWMLGISFIILPIVVFKQKITRFGGAILLTSYVLYVSFVI